jgi:hypothetical protein
MIEGCVVEHRPAGAWSEAGNTQVLGLCGQIEDAHRLVHEVLDIQHMRVAVGEAGIDVVVHRTGGELDLEVGLVLDRKAALGRIGVVILVWL